MNKALVHPVVSGGEFVGFLRLTVRVKPRQTTINLLEKTRRPRICTDDLFLCGDWP